MFDNPPPEQEYTFYYPASSLDVDSLSLIGDLSRMLEEGYSAEKLLAFLDDRRRPVRDAVAHALAELNEPGLIYTLIDLMQNGSHQARAASAQALGLLGDPFAIPDLVAALRSADGNLRLYAAGALVRLGDASVPALMDATTDEDWRVRLAAVWTLGELMYKVQGQDSWDQALEILYNALNDPNTEVSHIAARGLGRIGDPVVIPYLYQNLESDNSYAREDAVAFLGEFGEVDAVPYLIDRLNDDERGWRGLICDSAAVALTLIGTPEALDAVDEWNARRQEE
jgi:HEAT repeat protein